MLQKMPNGVHRRSIQPFTALTGFFDSTGSITAQARSAGGADDRQQRHRAPARGILLANAELAVIQPL